jgi:hypothetical protein
MIARLVDPTMQCSTSHGPHFCALVLPKTSCHERLAKEYENPTSKDDDKVSEPAVAASEIERKSVKLEPISLEEIRRQARENWLQSRQQMVSDAKKVASHSKDADRGTKEDQGHSIDGDLDE